MIPHRPCERRERAPTPRASGMRAAQQLQTVARIGRGSFGEVFLCAQVVAAPEAEAEAELVAVKKVGKARLRSEEQRAQLAMEVRVLRRASRCRFVVGFEWAHETEQDVYMCTEFCPGGDLFSLTENTDLSDDSCKLIVAQVAIALNYLHRNNIVYRDLKPENVALSRTGHVRLLDFGLATILTEEEHRNPENGRLEICSSSGTLAYTAPEVLRRVPHSFEADMWSLGMLAHELFSGSLPFLAEDPTAHCAQICEQPLDLSEHFDPCSSTASFVRALLQRERPRRLGYNLADFDEDVLGHPIFHGLDWPALADESQRLPYARPLAGPLDLSNFCDFAVQQP